MSTAFGCRLCLRQVVEFFRKIYDDFVGIVFLFWRAVPNLLAGKRHTLFLLRIYVRPIFISIFIICIFEVFPSQPLRIRHLPLRLSARPLRLAFSASTPSNYPSYILCRLFPPILHKRFRFPFQSLIVYIFCLQTFC